MVRLLILLTLALGACTSTNFETIFEGWIGHHTDELVSEWGQPESIDEMADSQEVLTYKGDYSVVIEVEEMSIIGSSWCQVEYTAGADGVIAAVDYYGNDPGCDRLLREKGKPPELKK